MFEKHKSGKQEPVRNQAPPANVAATTSAVESASKAAIIGKAIHINGDISGDEDLIIEGRVDGKIRLDSHQVNIGRSGQVNANITAQVIKIAGQVRGDMTGTEKVIILKSGNVNGNIVAPRMTLEDGAIFKGSIEMNPSDPAGSQAARPAAKNVPKVAEPSKLTKGDSAGQASSQGLNGR